MFKELAGDVVDRFTYICSEKEATISALKLEIAELKSVHETRQILTKETQSETHTFAQDVGRTGRSRNTTTD